MHLQQTTGLRGPAGVTALIEERAPKAAKLLCQGSAGVYGPCPQARRALSGGGEWTQLRFSFRWCGIVVCLFWAAHGRHTKNPCLGKNMTCRVSVVHTTLATSVDFTPADYVYWYLPES